VVEAAGVSYNCSIEILDERYQPMLVDREGAGMIRIPSDAISGGQDGLI
jgi:hypothetical protein